MRYYELEPEDNIFTALVADLTHRCNMECANCYIPNREVPDMDIDKLYSFLERLPKRIYVRLIGAEPTVRNDLSDIIRNVKSIGHKVSLTTNGLKLGHKEYVRELKDAGLRLVLISMNGAADDNIYKIIDNGKYANLKVRALHNCMLENMIINTGTIIAKGINEHTIDDQVNLFFSTMAETNYKPKVKPILRFKSVGKVGRHMEGDTTYTINELIDIFKQKFNIKPSNHPVQNTGRTAVDGMYGLIDAIYEYNNVLIRFVDWEVNDDGVVDSGSEFRGRITEDWKCAPFFENIKLNENGY